MKRTIFFSVVLFGTTMLTSHASDNFPTKPYGRATLLPEPGQFVITPWYIYTRWQRYFDGGGHRVSIEQKNTDDFEVNDGILNFEYGLSRDLALDLTLGYTSAATRFIDSLHQPRTTQGLMDTMLGVRYRLVDETRAGFEWWPTVTPRLGAIFQGTYDPDFPFAPGGGGTGIEPSLLLSKELLDTGLGVFGEGGWRWRNHHVPQELFGAAGVFQKIKGFTLSAAYRHAEGLSGRDVSGTGPGLKYSHKVKEVNQIVEGGVGYTDHGGRRYQFYMDWNFDGQNTGAKLTYGLFLSIPVGP